MKILVSGSTGFIGSALVPFLRGEGHEVLRLARPGRDLREDEVRWDPDAGEMDADALEGLDAAVHLAGESVAGLWTSAKKERILSSRERGTRLLAETLAARRRPPRVLISTSGVNYYGDRGDEVLTEESPPGTGFLADVTRAWEAGTVPAAEAGIRVAIFRFGIVLSPAGGALEQMLRPFRLGVGGRFGSGKQWMSWIALDDVLGVVRYALADEGLHGVANGVSPNPVRNAEFTRTLARVLGRPAFFAVPAAALRIALGQFGRETLLVSQRVLPARLQAAGYRFLYPELEGALRHVLG